MIWAFIRNNIWNENEAGFSRTAWIPSGASLDFEQALLPFHTRALSGRAVGTRGKAKLMKQHRHMGKLQTPARRQARPPREEEALLLGRAFQKWMCTVGNFLSPNSPGLEDYLVRDMWGGNRVGTEIKLLKIPFKL